MRMAKPDERDIDAAGQLMQILDTIDGRFGGPWGTEKGPDTLGDALGEEAFDCDDPAHLRGLYNSLAKLLRDAGGFQGRVIGGMCYVICYEKNKFLDPAKDYLALHPDVIEGLQLLDAHRADFLPHLEREARAAVAAVIEASAARHLAEMAATHKGAPHELL